ncbi:reverse transcriptase domain-containing protein [Tanacetum coccineum]
MGIVVSTIHEAIKFHTKKGIETVLLADETEEGTKRAKKILATKEERVLSCVNAEEKIIINDKYPDQTVTIKKQLPERFKKELQILLKSNVDIFAWTHTDMTGIPRTIMVEGKPFNMEHKQERFRSRLQHGSLDGGWRMCVDFIDINKACPKDCYPLPEIDWKIESLSGFHFKCFLDAYKGYYQIQMKEEDEDKTTFYAGERVFCYKKMPLCIKNAGATYQSLVDKVFSHQIGRNLKAYIDDIVIKSTSEKEMSKDIQEAFERFRSINMKLNPKKCSFGVEEGLFLGHLITKQGIKANPLKVKAVTNLDPPRTLKDIQSLNGKLAALSRFLSKGAERSLAFFKGPIRSRTQLSCLGEACTGIGSRSKKTLKILSGPHDNVDILVEIPFEDNKKKEKSKEAPDSNSKWRLYTDGASNLDRSGAGLMLIDPEGKEYTYALRFEFETTNNEAEYEALLAGLQIAQEMEIAKMAIFLDFQLLEKDVLKVDMQERKSWMDPIHEYLLRGLFPEDRKEARRIRIQAPQYKLIQGNLYKRSFFTSWLRCMAPP